MSMCRNLFVYGCISMQRYWSSLRYSILRTLFLLAADLRRHPPSPLYCLIYIRISCSFGRGCCSREHPDRCPLRLFRSFPLWAIYLYLSICIYIYIHRCLCVVICLYIYIYISCSFGRGCCSREHPDRCPLRRFLSFLLWAIYLYLYICIYIYIYISIYIYVCVAIYLYMVVSRCRVIGPPSGIPSSGLCFCWLPIFVVIPSPRSTV